MEDVVSCQPVGPRVGEKVEMSKKGHRISGKGPEKKVFRQQSDPDRGEV